MPPTTPIECGNTLSGSINYNPDSVTFEFVNDQQQDVTFTDCNSDFDPTLYLYDSNGNAIQSQSTNNCDGDDCDDYSICYTSVRETFTMASLAVGTYELELIPYSYGGWYEVEVICASNTPAPTFDPDCDVWAEIDGFSGEESVLNEKYEYDDVDTVYTKSELYEMRKTDDIWRIHI